MQLYYLFLISVLSCSVEAARRTEFLIRPDEALDMSYVYETNVTRYFPGIGSFVLTDMDLSAFAVYILAYTMCLPEHGGSHMDAPNHFAKGKLSVDQIKIKNLIAEGIRVDVTEKVKKKGRDYGLQVEDLTKWEEENGEIPESSIVLVYTGWGKKYHDKDFFKKNDQLSFPGIGEEAAKWLVSNRNIAAVGTDGPAIDPGAHSVYFPAHIAFSDANVYMLEMVANMDKLDGPKDFILSVMPMKIGGGSGGPTRVFAYKSSSSTTRINASVILLLALVCLV